jgi:nuclear transport factor 2 (NTF2) superfamily protein
LYFLDSVVFRLHNFRHPKPEMGISMTDLISYQSGLREMYEAFNSRDMEAVLGAMQSDVQWANDVTGSFVHGRDKVRQYWAVQFEQVQPHLEIRQVSIDERDRAIVIVHQTIRDLKGALLLEQDVGHRYTFRDGLVALFEIIDAEPKAASAAAD